MYLADSIGYLGYVVLLSIKPLFESSANKLALFQNTLYSLASFSILCLAIAAVYFQKKLSNKEAYWYVETPPPSELLLKDADIEFKLR